MVLNGNMTWAQAGNIPTGAQTTVRDAFFEGRAVKVQLPAGTELFKFSSYQKLTSNIYHDVRERVSPWWSPVLPYKQDVGLTQKKAIASSLGVSLREWARVTSVLNEGWNSIAWIIQIRLEQPVHGFFGEFSSQPRLAANPSQSKRAASEATGKTPRLPGGGGATQFYIPNLTMGDVKTIRSEFVPAKFAA